MDLMTQTQNLFADFPAASGADWRALVEKTLKDAPFESLRKQTVEGLAIEPLYAASSTPARLGLGVRDAARPWDVRVVVDHPEPARANADLLTDLEGGAASAVVAIDPKGAHGVAAASAADFAAVLQGVLLELAPVGLDAGFLGPKAADWLAAAAKGSPTALINLNLDPLSAFALAGESPGPIEGHLISAATVAARLAQAHPKASLFMASGRVVHEAGGGEAAELAFALASALAYAKAMVRAGMPMADALGGIVLGLAADGDYFVTLAKHRAARVLWARLAGACGVEGPARIETRSSRRMLTAQDPWTNMLRLASACVGAGLGGADAIALGAFTDALGRPTAFARRQSRNTQFVLMEEAHLGRVADPGAGSGYIEALTDEIAHAAWARFQAIEAQGGIVAALVAGDIAADVAAACAARDAAGPPRIVGVTAFPPATNEPVEVAPKVTYQVDSPAIGLPGPDSACPALTPIRLAQPYEAVQ